MHLISSLASGIRGAESGTAEIYVRGTSTRATYYTDFEAGTSVTTGADVSLDSNGGAEVYVNQYVDVVVKDSDGTTVREFTEGKAAPNIEYIGQSFTGVDYTTGASATSKPVNLQTILDLWYTSAGAADFNVSLGGSDLTLQAALGTVYGYFFNVKSSAYGAAGDGTTDDTTAIVSAITAAGASGGIVFFPAGVYRVTSQIDLPANVSLLGLGPENTFITMAHASNDLLELDGGSNGGFQFVEGIDFSAAQSYSGLLLTIDTDETFVNFHRCSFGGSYTTGKIVDIDVDHCVAKFDSCVFYPEEVPLSTPAIAITASGSQPDMTWNSFTGCRFVVSATQTAASSYMIKGSNFVVRDSVFDATLATNAVNVSYLYINKNYTTDIVGTVISGNYFIGSSVATIQAFLFTAVSGDTGHVLESNNYFSDDITVVPSTFDIAQSDDENISFHSLSDRMYDYGTDESVAITLDTKNYRIFYLTRNTNAVLTLSAYLAERGAFFTIVIRNSNGGAATGNITLNSSDFYEDTGVFTIAASSRRILTFRSEPSSGRWGVVNISGDI